MRTAEEGPFAAGDEVMGKAGLTLTRVTKHFGGELAVDDVSFEAPSGGFCVLLGPSGCGKSTVLRLVAGLERPDAGEIALDGRRLDDLAPRDRDVAMVFQSYALYPHLSVRENIAFGLRVRRVPRPEIAARVAEVARLLGIDRLLERKPAALSGGERQRVAMGRAIARKPALFLFDEPLSNLDANLRVEMRAELAALHRRLGVTTLYVTHDQAEAMTMAERLVVLRDGRVLQAGAPAEVYARPADAFVARFVGNPGMNLFQGRLAADGGAFEHRAFRAPLVPPVADLAGREVIAGLRPEDLAPASGERASEERGSGEREAAIPVRARGVEHLGATRFLHAAVEGEGAPVISAWRGPDPAPGAPLRLAFDPARLALFDAAGRARARPGRSV
jgi:multiple sugar transport system ATP-binding protein